jgi:adenine-specific DNA-methyltransferase
MARSGTDPPRDEDAPPALPVKSRESARLVWNSKPRRSPNPRDLEFQPAEVVFPNKAPTGSDLLIPRTAEGEVDDRSLNRLIWGDNLLVMQALLAQGFEGKVDLVYIDPPFLTSEDYKFTIDLADYGDVVKLPSLLERLAYRDTWDNGIDSYLDMLYPRLQLVRRLLSDRGSLYLHIGSNISHFVRAILDELFGDHRFLNEIIWKRTAAHNDPGRYGRIHDTILFYSKGENFVWNPPLGERSEESIEASFHYAEGPPPERKIAHVKRGEQPPKGYRRFQTVTLRSPHPRPNLRYDYKGYKPHPNGWSISPEIMERYDRESRLFFPSTKDGALRLKMYLDENPKIPIQDLWTDVNKIEAASAEQLRFDTQKPEALLERIISASSDENSIVADFFSGSGTTAAVADRLRRRWLAADFSKVAIQVTRARLVDQGASPFVIENIGNYQRELIYKEGANIALMQRIVLRLFGAEPHPTHADLGTLDERGKSVLVYVGYPDRPLTAKKTAELVKVARTLDGDGYDRLILLAWDYEYNYDEQLEIRRKGFGVQVDPRLIPPSIYDYLRKSKNPEDLIEKFAKKVHFGSKPYLKVGSPKVAEEKGEDSGVSLAIERYVLSEIPVENESDKAALQEISMGEQFGILIDYWAVDWDYDGKTFRSRWQDFRGSHKNRRSVTTRANTRLPRGRKYDIAVRVVDVFGNDATATTSVDLR